MRLDIARRFEVRGTRALAAVGEALRMAAHEQPEGPVACGVTAIERPPLLDVRLKGSMPAVFSVSDGARAIAGVSILRDRPTVLRRPTADLVYPDPDILLRIGIGPEGLSPAALERVGARPVTVAVVDSGLMVDHPDVRDHLLGIPTAGGAVRGARFIGARQGHDVTDEDGHGTMLAGTILAGAGRCPAVKLMPVKFFDGAVLPAPANAVAAIDFAVKHHADIINLSWDVGLGSDALRQSIGRACAAGALVVIAAGNDGSDNDRFPAVPARYAAECPWQVLIVMATDLYDERAWFSNYGSRTVDLAAPGVRIVTTRSALSPALAVGGRRYHRHSGTSAAAALVSGAAALLKCSEPRLTARDLKQRIVASVDRLPRLACASGGRLNVGRMLHATGAPGISPAGPPAGGGAPAGRGVPGPGSRSVS